MFLFRSKFFIYNTLLKRIEKRPGIPKIARVSLDIASTWLPVYMSKISIFKGSAFEAVLGLEGHPKIDQFLVYFKNLKYSSNLNSASVAQWSKAPVETLVVPGSNPRRAKKYFLHFFFHFLIIVIWAFKKKVSSNFNLSHAFIWSIFRHPSPLHIWFKINYVKKGREKVNYEVFVIQFCAFVFRTIFFK